MATGIKLVQNLYPFLRGSPQARRWLVREHGVHGVRKCPREAPRRGRTRIPFAPRVAWTPGQSSRIPRVADDAPEKPAEHVCSRDDAPAFPPQHDDVVVDRVVLAVGRPHPQQRQNVV